MRTKVQTRIADCQCETCRMRLPRATGVALALGVIVVAIGLWWIAKI